MDKVMEARRLLEQERAELEVALLAGKARLDAVTTVLAFLDVIDEAAEAGPDELPDDTDDDHAMGDAYDLSVQDSEPGVPADPVTLRESPRKKKVTDDGLVEAQLTAPRAAPSASRKSSRKKTTPSPTSTIDWAEVGRVVSEARARGGAESRAIKEHFGISIENALYRLKRVREMGLVPPPGVEAALVPAVDRPTTVPAAAPPKVVPKLLRDAMEHAGEIEPPRLASQSLGRPLNPARHSHVFTCSTEGCEFECDERRPLEMRAHTFTVHKGRAPTADEMTSVPRAG